MRKEGQVISVPDPRIPGPCPFPHVALVVKNPPAEAGDIRDAVRSLGWKDPWRKAWQPTPVFLPGESHGQRSLVGYSPQVTKMWARMKLLSTHVRSLDSSDGSCCSQWRRHQISFMNWLPGSYKKRSKREREQWHTPARFFSVWKRADLGLEAFQFMDDQVAANPPSGAPWLLLEPSDSPPRKQTHPQSPGFRPLTEALRDQ